jgi:hypothetical protein
MGSTMPKVSTEATLMAISTPEERLEFMLANFDSNALYDLFFSPIREIPDLGENWLKSLSQLLKLMCDIQPWQPGEDRGSLGKFRQLLDIEHLRSKSVGTQFQSDLELYLLSLPGVKDASEALSASALQSHGNLAVIIDQGISTLLRRLQGSDSMAGQKRSSRPGDVILEGPGFEVVVGPKYQYMMRYPDGKTAIILMHDPRDGHFLLVERFSEIDSLYVLEFPRVPASKMHNRENAAAILLQELTGLPLRPLEKLGEIRPDTHMIAGSCEVYYGTFDLEENIVPNTKLIRDVKRMTEDGLYEGGYDKRITCAQTLAAISIWRAFEFVRKKREANSRRVRNPRSPSDVE